MNYSMNADNSALFFDNRIWDEWLSTSEAAKFLSTTPNAVRIMVCQGHGNGCCFVVYTFLHMAQPVGGHPECQRFRQGQYPGHAPANAGNGPPGQHDHFLAFSGLKIL